MTTSHRSRVVLGSVAALACAAAPALAATIAGAGPERGATYAGSIGPGYPISFKVSPSGTTIEDLKVHFEATCNPGAGSTAPRFPFSTLAIKDGKFAGDSDLGGGGVETSIRLEGSFDGRKASGKVVAHQSIKSLGSCSQTEPFTADVK